MESTYGKEAEEADSKKAEKAKKAKSDWTGFPIAPGPAQSS